MEIRYLSPEEKERSRELYEDCFPEDTERFVDYYYKEKCKDNQILVLEDQEEICSMIHLNPFTISMYGNLAQVCYIVAVATREDCRRNGYMLQLMKRAFYDRYRAGDPFTFLIPANPDYYYSCGFDFWENQRELKQDQDTIWNENRTVAAAKPADCEEMAGYSNRVLAKRFDLFIQKDEAYYERLIREQESEDGHVVILRDVHKPYEICGLFSFDRECGVEIREPVMEDCCTETVHPIMMGRVLNLERFCGMIKCNEKIRRNLEIRDELIPENNGTFCITIDENGGQAVRIHGLQVEESLDIAEFGKQMFHDMRIYINEVV